MTAQTIEDGSRAARAHDWTRIRAGNFRGSLDIHGLVDEMRGHGPAWRAPWNDVYVSSYQLVADCLADRGLSHVPPDPEAAPDGRRPAIRDWLIYQEGRAHAVIRRALQQPFAGSGARMLRAVVDEAVEMLVGTACPAGEVDVVAAFTRAIPERVIGDLLGVPHADLPLLRAWSASIRSILDAGFDDAFDGATNAADDMSAYFEELARQLLARGETPPLLAGLPSLADRLGIAAAGRNLAFLAFAGHETTVHLLGNMLFHLAQAPSCWSALRADPRTAGRAVAETLRLESPVQKICRWPTRSIDLGGLTVERGTLVVLLAGAANRDPARFPDPHRFEPGRTGPAHLAFGRGAHACIGRALAEMEGRSMLEALLRKWRTIEPAGDAAAWMDNSSIRGLDRLVLRVKD